MAVNDYIVVNKSAGDRATKAIRLIGLIREVQQLTKHVKANMDHSYVGVDYTGLESAYGLQTGQGVNFIALVDAARTRINHGDVDLLIDRVGE